MNKVLPEADNGNKSTPVDIPHVSSDIPDGPTPPVQVADNTGEPSQNADDGVPSETEVPIDPRLAIADKHAQRRSEELGESEPEPEVEDPETQTPDPVEQPATVEIRVNGRVRLVDREKVEAGGGVEVYQKNLAADERLRYAAQEQKRIDAERAKLKEERQSREQQPQPKAEDSGSNDPPDSGDQDAENLAETARKYREALLDGNDKVADVLLVEMLSQAKGSEPSTPQIDIDQIRSEAADVAVARIEQQRNRSSLVSAANEFLQKNPEVKKDPRLWQMVDRETEAIARDNPGWGHAKVLSEAYVNVNRWRGVAPQSATTIAKVDEKRSMQTPRAGSVRDAGTPPPRRQSDSEYVLALRKQRGLE